MSHGEKTIQKKNGIKNVRKCGDVGKNFDLNCSVGILSGRTFSTTNAGSQMGILWKDGRTSLALRRGVAGSCRRPSPFSGGEGGSFLVKGGLWRVGRVSSVRALKEVRQKKS